MKSRIWIYFLVLILILTGFFSFSSKIFKVQAQDPPDIYAKVEASLDNGATWHNYASTKNAGSETLTIKGGDTILIRVKMWNESTDTDVTDAIGEGYLTNTDYISNSELVSLDEDENSIFFEGYFWGISGTGVVDLSSQGSESSGYESLTVRITIANNIPANTSIEGKVTVTNEGEIVFNSFHKNFGIPKVFADGIGRYSLCRMATADALPQTGADL